MRYLRLFFFVAIFSTSATTAFAQNFTRTNPKFLQAFREVVAGPADSTVRVLCDGKDTALGMIVGADGWILTKANDLQGKVACKLKDGRQFDAEVVGVHKVHDLAMLKIAATDLKAVEFKESKKVGVGDWVACAGTGSDPVAIGVVSVATRNVKTKGPLLSIDTTKAGYLGVALEPADGGLRVVQVMPSSAAVKAGVQTDDLVLSLNGKKIEEVDQFIQTIGGKKPGDLVTLRIRRGEDDLELKATLGKRPPNQTRGDIQNKMGSDLSSRRSGYPTILQHDSVVRPSDCGGPIVDLEGRVIGINICRAGRTESWAVPTEVIQSVLADLKSGKLAPSELKKEEPK